MSKTKITSEDIFNRIREIEEDLLHIPITDHFLDISLEKDRLLSVYACLRIAEALEQNSMGLHHLNLNSPIITTEKISGEKESRPSSLSAYSGNPSPLPSEKHRKNWEEILHEEKPKGKTLAEIFAEEEDRKSKKEEKPSSSEKFFGEKKFDLDKINKVAHLLADRARLIKIRDKTDEQEKTLETINAYLETYGLKDTEGTGTLDLDFFGGEMSYMEQHIAFSFGSILYNPNSEHELELKYFRSQGLVPVKEKTGDKEIESLAYLPEEKAEQ
jgi:hypothetical protein